MCADKAFVIANVERTFQFASALTKTGLGMMVRLDWDSLVEDETRKGRRTTGKRARKGAAK